jgi:hypothetical protein
MSMMIALAIALMGSLESPSYPQDIIVPATQQASDLIDFVQGRVFLRYQFPDGRRIDLDSAKWDSCNLWTGNPLGVTAFATGSPWTGPWTISKQAWDWNSTGNPMSTAARSAHPLKEETC